MNTPSRPDLAEAAAVVLTSADVPPVYSFTGRLWTYPELAAALSDSSGRTVAYREVSEDAGAIGFMGLAPVVQAGGFEVQTTDPQTVLGRQPGDLQGAVALALN